MNILSHCNIDRYIYLGKFFFRNLSKKKPMDKYLDIPKIQYLTKKNNQILIIVIVNNNIWMKNSI